jgi:hypothetical protein
VALAASGADFGRSGSSGGVVALAVAFAGSPSAVLFGLPPAASAQQGAQRLPCLAGVPLPEPPAALAFAGPSAEAAQGGSGAALGTLLALCPAPPLLHRFAVSGSSDSSGSVSVAGMRCPMAAKLVAVAERLGLTVLPALAMADHDLNSSEDAMGGGDGGGDGPEAAAAAADGGGGADDGADGDAPERGFKTKGDGKKKTKGKGEVFDNGTSELRKKQISHAQSDWNSRKRFKGKGNGGDGTCATEVTGGLKGKGDGE